MSYAAVPVHHLHPSANIPRRAFIRRGNGGRLTPVSGLGFWSAIPAIITAVTAIGTGAYSVYASEQDKKQAKKDAEKAAARAAAAQAAAAAEQKRVDDAQIAATQQTTKAQTAAAQATGHALSVWIPVGIGGAVVLGGLAFFLLRRKRK